MELKYFFEALMLLCFGVSWPISIFKLLKVKNSSGKSPLFLILIIVGYIAGIGFKLLQDGGQWVMAVYILNILLVSTDLCLTLKYSKRS